MITSDVIYSSWLTNNVGPSKSLKRFGKNIDFFYSEDIKLNIYSLDIMRSREFSTKKSEAVLLKKYLEEVENWAANHIDLFMWLSLTKRYASWDKKILKYYFRLNCKSDVIIFHNFFACYYYLKQVRQKSAKVVLVSHTSGEDFKMLRIYYQKLSKSKYYDYLIEMYRYVLGRVDRKVFISKSAIKVFTENYPDFPEDKIDLLYNGIESEGYEYDVHLCQEKYGKKKDVYRLICVGSVNDRKGQEVIVEAVKNMSIEKRNKIKIDFVGDGPLCEYLRKKVSEYNLSNNISFVGAKDDVESYLVNSDLFILTSKEEGVPIAIIEAMRMGLPIISTDVGGVGELVIDGYNGLLIKSGSKYLSGLLEHIGDYNWLRMSNNSYHRFKKYFTLNSMMKMYSDIIKSVYDEKG